MNMFNTSFYIKSPVAVQKTMIHSRGFICKLLREGALFKRILAELEQSQFYSAQELKRLQNEKLRRVIAHSYENVPYYRRLFKQLKLRPHDFRDVSDLKKLPIISKSDVRKNPDDFLAKNINKCFIRKVFTSGTTGSPLKIYRDLYSINFENAILKRQYRWAGFNENDRKVVLRSSAVVPPRIKKPPFWRYDFFQKAMLISSYHLSRKNIKSYVNEIRRYAPGALETIPSSAYLMAKLVNLESANLKFSHIFLSSELLDPHKKSFIEKEFGGRIFDHYGTGERVSAIGMCEEGVYHIYPEYSVTELIPLSDDKEHLEIVGTPLNNFAMPLLRYKTEDIVRVSKERCRCRRAFKTVKSLDGRATDKFFMMSDGRLVSFFVGALNIDLNGLIETQFIQESLDAITVKIVIEDKFSVSDESKLKESLKNYLGNDITINIEKAQFIPRTAGGKFKPFISKLEKEML